MDVISVLNTERRRLAGELKAVEKVLRKLRGRSLNAIGRTTRKARRMSQSARKRIAQAQKARWAAT